MGWRVAGAMVLAACLAGCADHEQFTGLSALATATSEPAAQGQADPSFRFNELKPGLSKAELESLYPNRMVAGGKFGRNQYFYVEPVNLTTGTKVARDRLELFVTDGKLAAFAVAHSDGEVMGPTELGELPIVSSGPPAAPPAKLKKPKAAPPVTASATPPAMASTTAPAGKYAVQIGAPRSEAEARALIDQLRAKHPALLGRQWAEIHRVELPKGVVYRVVIGPLATSQQASQLCNGLRAQGTACFLRGT